MSREKLLGLLAVEAEHQEGDSSKMDMKWSYALEPKEGLNAKQLKLVGGKLSLKVVRVVAEPPADGDGDGGGDGDGDGGGGRSSPAVSPVAGGGLGGMLNMGQKMGQMVTSGGKELLHKAHDAAHAAHMATHHHEGEEAERGDAGATEAEAEGGEKATEGAKGGEGGEKATEGAEGADVVRSRTRKMSTEQIEHDAEEALEEDHDLDDDAAAFFKAEAER